MVFSMVAVTILFFMHIKSPFELVICIINYCIIKNKLFSTKIKIIINLFIITLKEKLNSIKINIASNSPKFIKLEYILYINKNTEI